MLAETPEMITLPGYGIGGKSEGIDAIKTEALIRSVLSLDEV